MTQQINTYLSTFLEESSSQRPPSRPPNFREVDGLWIEVIPESGIYDFDGGLVFGVQPQEGYSKMVMATNDGLYQVRISKDLPIFRFTCIAGKLRRSEEGYWTANDNELTVTSRVSEIYLRENFDN